MNPQLILAAAKVAYENREVASKLLDKIKDWKQQKSGDGEPGEERLSLEERVDRLERQAERNAKLVAEQSGLIEGLVNNVSELSVVNQALSKKVKWLALGLLLSMAVAAVSLFMVINAG